LIALVLGKCFFNHAFNISEENGVGNQIVVYEVYNGANVFSFMRLILVKEKA